jgi:hypothetical protein
MLDSQDPTIHQGARDLEALEKLFSLSPLSTRVIFHRRSISLSPSLTKQQYIQSSDPIRAFREECLTENPSSVTTKDDVYNAYVQYCQNHNLPATTKNSFSMNLPK